MFSVDLTKWYFQNKRELPWRKTKNPYLIWLSEVILQQTRVAQGLPYYLRFAEAFPSVHDLAGADEQAVLKLWQGLGYYSRGRNLHKTARIIAEEHQGEFPNTFKGLLSLPGIGEYTAAAISSFAFDQPHPVIDGNVIRVISRYKGITERPDSTAGRKIMRQHAEELIDKGDPASYNQAIMELGATVCLPGKPVCSECPVSDGCIAHATGMQEQLPAAKAKTSVKKVYLNYLVHHSPEGLAMKCRTQKGIWRNLYDFPLVEADSVLSRKALEKKKQIRIISSSSPYTHILSHRHLTAVFHKVEGTLCEPGVAYVSPEKLSALPVSRLIERYLVDEGLI